MRRVIKNSLFGAATTIVVFTLLEIAARGYSAVRHSNAGAWTYGQSFASKVLRGTVLLQNQYPFTSVEQQIDTTDWMFRNRSAADPDVHLLDVEPVDAFSGGVNSHLNHAGLRGPDFLPEPKPGVTRIVTLGGSFVMGWGVTDRATWPSVLNDELNASAPRYEVINGGVNGANIHKVLSGLVRLSNDARIDHVVIASAYNDHATLRTERLFPASARVDFFLYNLSLLYVMTREALSRFGRQPLDYSLYRQRVRVDPADLEVWVATYRRRLEQIDILCRERGIEPIFLAEPELFFDKTINELSLFDGHALERLEATLQSRHSLWRMELEYYLQARLDIEMRRFASEHEAIFFDGASLFPSDRQGFFLDQIHLNEGGSRRLGEQFARFLTGALHEFHARPAPRSNAQPSGAADCHDDALPKEPSLIGASYAQTMQAVNRVSRRLQCEVKTARFDEIASDAGLLQQYFVSVKGYWADQRNTDGLASAREGEKASAALVAAAAATDARATSRALRTLNATCRSCHEAHRRRLPDGGSGIK